MKTEKDEPIQFLIHVCIAGSAIPVCSIDCVDTKVEWFKPEDINASGIANILKKAMGELTENQCTCDGLLPCTKVHSEWPPRDSKGKCIIEDGNY